MSNDAIEDHLPPEPTPESIAAAAANRRKESEDVPRRSASFVLLDRVLFTALGLVCGFALAWIWLEKAPGPAAHEHTVADPHAGVEGAPPLDPASRTARVPPAAAPGAALPDGYDELVNLGNAAFDAGAHARAAEAYEKALATKPGNPNVLTDLGVSYRNLGRFDESIAMFEKALAASPTHWQALYNKALVLAMDKKDLAGARAALASLKKMKPEEGVVQRLEDALK